MSASLDALRLGIGLPERIAARIRLLLASAPNAEKSALYLDRLRHESASAFDRIMSSPSAMRCAVAVFSYSTFLSEAIVRFPERILQVAAAGNLYRLMTAEEYEQRLT